MFEKINQLYQGLQIEDSPPDLHIIDGLPIPLSKSWQRVAVNLSGGADSAMLTVLLAEIIRSNSLSTKIDIITFIRNWETRPWQSYIALSVVDKIKSMYPDIIDQHHIQYMPPELESSKVPVLVNGRSYDNIVTASYNRFVAYSAGLDAVYNATSRAPDDVALLKKLPPGRNTPESNTKLGDLIFKLDDGVMYCHPFKLTTKDWILRQYRRMSLGSLLATTRSCEASITDTTIELYVPDLDSYKPGQYIPVCGACWWCRERKWAAAKIAESNNINN